MANRFFAIATAAGLVLAGAACTQRDDDSTAQAPPPPTAPEPAPPALGAVKLGTASGPDAAISETKQKFAPGEPIHLSMELLGAGPGTTVTTYWYGPNDRRLAYETKTGAPPQQLHFTQDNTADWPEGHYRAEVWIGEDKVQEQSFEIAAG